MQSPFMSGSQGEFFGTPPGLPQLLLAGQDRANQLEQGAANGVGSLISGIVGAVQANRRDPADAAGRTFGQEAFGSDVSAPGAAWKGFLRNFGNFGDSGGGSAFARMTNPGATGAGGMSSEGMNLKQFAALGRMADATYHAMAPNTPTTAGQEPTVMGVTPTMWKHLGTQDKINWLAGAKQANDMQVAQQAQQEMGARIQDFAAQAKLRQTQAQADAGMGQMLDNLPKTGSNPDGSYSLQDYVNAARGANLNPRVQGMLLRSLVTPGNTEKPSFTEDPVTGMRAVTYGKSIIPTGINPNKAGPYTVMVDNGAGGQLPVLVSPKTGAGTQLRTGALTDSQRLNSIDTQIKAIRSLPAQFRSQEDADDLSQLLQSRQSILSRAPAAAGPTTKPASAPTAPTAPSYKSAADVKAAYDAGKLDKPAATKILQNQFGMK